MLLLTLQHRVYISFIDVASLNTFLPSLDKIGLSSLLFRLSKKNILPSSLENIKFSVFINKPSDIFIQILHFEQTNSWLFLFRVVLHEGHSIVLIFLSILIMVFTKVSSEGKDRTCNNMVQSHGLCQLSYFGSFSILSINSKKSFDALIRSSP